MVDCNATQAAIRAGFKEKSANEQGSRLLANVSIAAEIAHRREVLARRFDVSAESVLSEYAKLARARITDYLSYGPDGVQVRRSNELTPDQFDAIAEVTERIGKGGKRVVSVKLHSKTEALERLGKHLGLFIERHQHDVTEQLSHALTEIKARMSGGAQEELIRAVGHVMAEKLAPAADKPAGESNS
jgi:phage terminase small subunit